MVSTPTKAGVAGFAGTVGTEVTMGLDRAAQVAGGVLNSVFGGVVSAVTGGGDAAGMVAPTVLEALAVIL